MIRSCEPADVEDIYEVINDAAAAYRGVIAPDCWREPYMSRDEKRVALDVWGRQVAAIVSETDGSSNVLTFSRG